MVRGRDPIYLTQPNSTLEAQTSSKTDRCLLKTGSHEASYCTVGIVEQRFFENGTGDAL